MSPENTRAIRIPKSSPEKTMERAVARREGGARSAVSGRRTCGVTDEMPVRKERTWNVRREWVRERPMVREAEIIMRMRRS